MDEFADLFSLKGVADLANAPVGAGRIINVDDPRHPFVVSGLRLFDISDVEHPREVAYFNQPVRPGSRPSFPDVAGAYAMSAPAWDRKRGSVWYTDANSGFYNVLLTNGVARLLR